MLVTTLTIPPPSETAPARRRTAPDPSAAALMDLVRWQVAFGPRYPGSQSHRLFGEALHDRMAAAADRVEVQEFEVNLNGRSCPCRNIAGLFRGRGAGSRDAGGAGRPGPDSGRPGPLLVGSHFDTRLIADREPDPALRGLPIPGANDGGSGTAVILALAELLAERRPARDVQLVLFDAEDVGGISGNEFGAGAQRWADRPLLPPPSEALILDMVGGQGMVFDIDAHIASFPGSLAWSGRFFRIGASLELPPFIGRKPRQVKYIISDHTPFLLAGIPTCLLIDLDYPQWHTQADLPEAMSGGSLSSVLKAIESLLFPPRGSDRGSSRATGDPSG